MKLHYDPETDSLYIELKAEPGVETREVAEGLIVDLDAQGQVVGFDFDGASTQFDITTLETIALPLNEIRSDVVSMEQGRVSNSKSRELKK